MFYLTYLFDNRWSGLFKSGCYDLVNKSKHFAQVAMLHYITVGKVAIYMYVLIGVYTCASWKFSVRLL
jgi:hypothetical protein